MEDNVNGLDRYLAEVLDFIGVICSKIVIVSNISFKFQALMTPRIELHLKRIF